MIEIMWNEFLLDLLGDVFGEVFEEFPQLMIMAITREEEEEDEGEQVEEKERGLTWKRVNRTSRSDSRRHV